MFNLPSLLLFIFNFFLISVGLGLVLFISPFTGPFSLGLERDFGRVPLQEDSKHDKMQDKLSKHDDNQ